MTDTGPTRIPRTPAEWREWGVDTEPVLQHADRRPGYGTAAVIPLPVRHRAAGRLADYAPAVKAALWIILTFDIVVAALGLYALAPAVLILTAQAVGAYTYMRVQGGARRLLAARRARASRS